MFEAAAELLLIAGGLALGGFLIIDHIDRLIRGEPCMKGDETEANGIEYVYYCVVYDRDGGEDYEGPFDCYHDADSHGINQLDHPRWVSYEIDAQVRGGGVWK